MSEQPDWSAPVGARGSYGGLQAPVFRYIDRERGLVALPDADPGPPPVPDGLASEAKLLAMRYEMGLVKGAEATLQSQELRARYLAAGLSGGQFEQEVTRHLTPQPPPPPPQPPPPFPFSGA